MKDGTTEGWTNRGIILSNEGFAVVGCGKKKKLIQKRKSSCFTGLSTFKP